MPKAAVIDMKKVSWWADAEKPVLREIDWKVSASQHWVVLGLNGSGKTSLMRLINAYLTPSSGSMRVLGKRYGEYDWREMRKRIGFVSSSLTESMYATESAMEIVLSGLYATLGLYDEPQSSDMKKALKALKSLGMEEFRDSPFGTLSQGERQRVLVARALVSGPEILILDEPCEGLDIIAREALLDSLASMASSQSAPVIIYVTHRPEEILPLFTHALLLREGSVFTSGRVRDVITSDTLCGFYKRSTDVHWKDDRPWISF